MNLLLLAFALYAITLIAIGWYSYQLTKTSHDFLLGGRQASYWVTAISAHASDMSSWLFMGFPGAIYAYGLDILWVPIGLTIGMWATWQFVAPGIRTLSAQYRSVTFATFMEKSSGDQSGIIRVLVSLFSIFFFMFYIASGLKGVSMLLDSVFNLPSQYGLSIGVALVVSYTILGGYIAVTLTDFLQGLFLLVMIIIVPLYALNNVTLSSISSAAQIIGTNLSFIPTTGSHLLSSIAIAISWGLGYFGMPHVLVKFMGIDDVQNMKRAQYIGMLWQILVLSAATAIGIISIGYFNGSLLDPEQAFIVMVQELFSPFFAGIVLCAIFAAILSTIDSQVLVAAALMAHDIYRGSKYTVFVTRMSIIALSVASGLLALYADTTVHGIVQYAWTGLGATFGPAVLMSFYTKKNTPVSMASGMLVGGLCSVLWPLAVPHLSQFAMIPSVMAHFIAAGSMLYLRPKRLVQGQ